jgi:two-component sensor histidine kinase
MRPPKIFLKSFLAVFVLSGIYMGAIFFFFIPKIEHNIIQLENAIGKAQLDKTVRIIQDSAQELKRFKAIALQEHKDKLKKLTETVYSIIQYKYHQSLREGSDVQQIQNDALCLISGLQYGNRDYFYVSGYDSVLISHPYLQNKDFSTIKDMHGNLIVPPLVKIAREKGEGFYRYWWKKNNADPKPYEKLTFAKNFAPWKWVVGTGVYIDDIDQEISSRKHKLIERLKSVLHTTQIGDSGYVYVFDSLGNMLIHPDKHVENSNFSTWKNPGKSSYIFDDLIHAYRHGDKTLYYNWNKPTDKDNYTYKKVSWIEYEPNFDWYICSSAYLDEFYLDSENLKRFIAYFSLLILLLLVAIGFYFWKQIFSPIIALARNAEEVRQGNLKSRYEGVINDDETGLLASEFNHMLDTINHQLETLDRNVQEKTKELTTALDEKELLLRELHHRVKNNLYVINSIVGLQSFQKDTMSIDACVQVLQERIHSIALGHEMLYKSHLLSKASAQEYLMTLVQSIIDAYVDDPEACECVYDIDPIVLEMDALISIGLIVNELVTNAVKHAFASHKPWLKVSLKKKNNSIELQIEDRGTGLDKSPHGGIGLELVTMLVQQHGGNWKHRVDGGTHILVTLPEIEL